MRDEEATGSLDAASPSPAAGSGAGRPFCAGFSRLEKFIPPALDGRRSGGAMLGDQKQNGRRVALCPHEHIDKRTPRVHLMTASDMDLIAARARLQLHSGRARDRSPSTRYCRRPLVPSQPRAKRWHVRRDIATLPRTQAHAVATPGLLKAPHPSPSVKFVRSPTRQDGVAGRHGQTACTGKPRKELPRAWSVYKATCFL